MHKALILLISCLAIACNPVNWDVEGTNDKATDNTIVSAPSQNNALLIVVEPKDCVNCIGGINHVLKYFQQNYADKDIEIHVVFARSRRKVARQKFSEMLMPRENSSWVVDHDLYKSLIHSCPAYPTRSIILIRNETQQICLNPKMVDMPVVQQQFEEVFGS